MTTLQIVLLIVFALCILSSGFLSGSETAIVAVPRERAHQLAQRGKRGMRLELLLADLEGTIGTLLLANNFVNILGASVATVLAIDLVGESWGPWLSTVTVTAIILVVGEITPKTLAARRPDQYALTVAGGPLETEPGASAGSPTVCGGEPGHPPDARGPCHPRIDTRDRRGHPIDGCARGGRGRNRGG